MTFTDYRFILFKIDFSVPSNSIDLKSLISIMRPTYSKCNATITECGGLDLHSWCETIDGKIIDADFKIYDTIKEMNKCEGEKKYCELIGEDKKKIWKLIWKNAIHPKIKAMNEIGINDWVGFWRNLDEAQQSLNCFLNAYVYHIQNPKTSRLCFGKMGWKKQNSKQIWWEFG